MQPTDIPAPTLDEIWRLFKETDRKFQETDRKFQETTGEIEQVSSNIGKLDNPLGDFVKERLRPAAVRLFGERGIDVFKSTKTQ
jgi:hypothetical protein